MRKQRALTRYVVIRAIVTKLGRAARSRVAVAEMYRLLDADPKARH